MMKHNLRQFFPGIDYDSGIVKLSGGGTGGWRNE